MNNPPGILKIHKLTASIIDGKQHIEMAMDLKNNSALHQAQISKGNSGLVLGWNKLHNRAETIHFAVRRNDLLGVKSLLFQVMDTQGNMNRETLPITLPAKAEKPVEIDEPEEDPKNVEATRKLLSQWGKLKR